MLKREYAAKAEFLQIRILKNLNDYALGGFCPCSLTFLWFYSG